MTKELGKVQKAKTKLEAETGKHFERMTLDAKRKEERIAKLAADAQLKAAETETLAAELARSQRSLADLQHAHGITAAELSVDATVDASVESALKLLQHGSPVTYQTPHLD